MGVLGKDVSQGANGALLLYPQQRLEVGLGRRAEIHVAILTEIDLLRRSARQQWHDSPLGGVGDVSAETPARSASE